MQEGWIIMWLFKAATAKVMGLGTCCVEELAGGEQGGGAHEGGRQGRLRFRNKESPMLPPRRSASGCSPKAAQGAPPALPAPATLLDDSGSKDRAASCSRGRRRCQPSVSTTLSWRPRMDSRESADSSWGTSHNSQLLRDSSLSCCSGSRCCQPPLSRSLQERSSLESAVRADDSSSGSAAVPHADKARSCS